MSSDNEPVALPGNTSEGQCNGTTSMAKRKHRGKPFLSILAKQCKNQIMAIIGGLITLAEDIALLLGLIRKNEDASVILSETIPLLIIYIIILIGALVLLVYNVYSFYAEYKNISKRIFVDDDKTSIDNYLSQFIESGESVAIVTHDMSWLSDKNIEMMKNKASKKELLLFLPDKTPQIRELEMLGADVRCYGKILNDPANPLVRSRMTIVNYSKPFPVLTYPVRKEGLHINYELPSGEPANQLAQDLIQLLLYVSKEKNDEEEKADGDH